MIPVPKSQVESVVGPIIGGQADQYGFTGKEISEHMVKSLVSCYENKTMFSYVDSLENTQACLICGYSFSMMFPGTHITGYLIWVAPELRGTKAGFAKVKEMMTTLEDFGKMFNAKSIMVGAWLFRDKGPNSKKLWPRFGYEPQELVMVKELK